MKISLFTRALAASLGLALISAPVTIHAQTTAAAPTPAPATPPATTTAKAKSKSKAGTIEYAGKLTAIDVAANDITITGTKRTLMLKLTAKTSYKVNKKPATLADFAVGDKVTGSYVKNADGSLTAHSLHKNTMAKSVAKAPPTASVAPATPATPPAQ